ncbi:MAG: hypothetical protein P4L38_00075 [Syntrophaceae bacterium]|nr:hypothetical protein [Syntrophaceae bacterium]
MDRFEYEITRYPAETFSRVVYFCTDKGDCGINEIPAEEPLALVELLNERGADGWELVQLLFGNGGVMACWKRKIADVFEV